MTLQVRAAREADRETWFWSGLPWWGSLMLSTGLFRLLLTLPAHITQQKVSAKRYLMTEEMKTEILPAIQKMTDRWSWFVLRVSNLSLQTRHTQQVE